MCVTWGGGEIEEGEVRIQAYLFLRGVECTSIALVIHFNRNLVMECGSHDAIASYGNLSELKFCNTQGDIL